MKSIKLNVMGLNCPRFKMLLKETLEETEGLENAEVSKTDGTVYIYYDEHAANEMLIKVLIRKYGFKVE